jgi:hypothetical protein
MLMNQEGSIGCGRESSIPSDAILVRPDYELTTETRIALGNKTVSKLHITIQIGDVPQGAVVDPFRLW